jgi:hypothetical protein
MDWNDARIPSREPITSLSQPSCSCFPVFAPVSTFSHQYAKNDPFGAGIERFGSKTSPLLVHFRPPRPFPTLEFESETQNEKSEYLQQLNFK